MFNFVDVLYYILYRLEQLQNGSLVNTSALLFAHTETVMPFLTSLGLFRDPAPLTVGHLAKACSVTWPHLY